jgi:hypothetical protein
VRRGCVRRVRDQKLYLCCHTYLDTSVSRTWTDSVNLGCDNRCTCEHVWVRRGATGRVHYMWVRVRVCSFPQNKIYMIWRRPTSAESILWKVSRVFSRRIYRIFTTLLLESCRFILQDYRMTDSFLYKYLYTEKEQALFSVRDLKRFALYAFPSSVSWKRCNSNAVRSRIRHPRWKMHFWIFEIFSVTPVSPDKQGTQRTRVNVSVHW